MKPIIFCHASCTDGFGAAYAAWTQLGNNADYVPVQYGIVKTLNDVDLLGNIKGRDVYILDFSFPHDVMTYIMAEAARTIWLDHHKTAFEMWTPTAQITPTSLYSLTDDTSTILLDNSRSGAMLAWEYFNPNDPAPALIEYIQDYDLWRFSYTHTKPFNKALWASAPWSFEQWDNIAKFNSEDLTGFCAVGEALLRDHTNRVTTHVKKSRCCAIAGKPGLAINAPGYVSSDAGHELAVQCGTYGMTYTIDDHLMVKVSLRSNGDYDVSALAKSMGGGGHKNAAGFECTMQVLTNILVPE